MVETMHLSSGSGGVISFGVAVFRTVGCRFSTVKEQRQSRFCACDCVTSRRARSPGVTVSFRPITLDFDR